MQLNKVDYDDEADAVSILLSTSRPHHVVEVPGLRGLGIDVDAEGRIVGIEILFASVTVAGETFKPKKRASKTVA
jgi:uncharacterized protein YuzE